MPRNAAAQVTDHNGEDEGYHRNPEGVNHWGSAGQFLRPICLHTGKRRAPQWLKNREKNRNEKDDAGRARIEQMAVARVLEFFSGQRPKDVCNPRVWEVGLRG